MKKYILFLLVLSCVSCSTDTFKTFKYPKLKNVAKTENHYNINYINHYNNLESLNDSTSLSWYKKQDSLAEDYFSSNTDYNSLFLKYESLDNRETDPARNVKRVESGFTFYISTKDDSEEEYLFKSKFEGVDKQIVYDPKQFGDGEYEIEYYAPSHDGNYIAIALSKTEDFFNKVIIVNCETGKPLNKAINNTKPEKAGGIVWTPNNDAILYIKYPNDDNDRNSFTEKYEIKKNRFQTIFKDELNGISLFEEDYPVPMIRSSKSNFIFIHEGNASDFWNTYYMKIIDFNSGSLNWKKLYDVSDSIFHNWGTERRGKYYYKRTKNENIELCVVDLEELNFESPKVLASGKGNTQITGFEITKDNIYYAVSKDGIESNLYKYNESIEDEKLTLPTHAGDITFDYRSPYHNDLWIEVSSWLSNPKTYVLTNKGDFEFVELARWADYPEYNNLIAEVVEVESHDGVKVPMSIVRRKDHKMNSTSMGIITAYGAYGISETPWYHSPIADFVNEGNIYVSAHVRGGGEKGPKWHEEGMKSTKENSWKDLIACSDYLIKNMYIHPKKLGLNINSAGGIAGGMAVNERPELFGTFTGFVPLLNVIRTEYIDEIDDSDTAFEFGTIKEKASYMDLLKMDPVVNLSKNNSYPSTLLTIGFKDNLIHPSSAGKYIATLQSFNLNNTKPYLLDIKFDAEHEIDWVEDYAKMLFFTKNELKKRN